MKTLRGASAFVCIPAYDTPGRKDSSGAFRPQAAQLVKTLGLFASVRLFDSNRAMIDRRQEVSNALSRLTDLDMVAFLCHGWRDGIQAGWKLGQVPDLAARIRKACKEDATIALYCCDTARDGDDHREDDVSGGPGGKGGFASALWVALEALGFKGTLWAHPTTAHTTQNPHVRVWRVDEEPELGDWACEPHSEHWGKWCRAMRLSEWKFRMLQCQTADELETAIARLP
jgi:hypothetical protein